MTTESELKRTFSAEDLAKFDEKFMEMMRNNVPPGIIALNIELFFGDPANF